MRGGATSSDDGSAGGRASRSVGRPRTLDAGQNSLALLLNLVRAGQSTTRQELERKSELGRAAVADRLATLATLGLIAEGELGPANGGRAPRHVSFRIEAGVLLLAALDDASIAVGIADLSGRLLGEHHEALDAAESRASVYERMQVLLAWMHQEQADGAEVWGVGIAVPGPGEQSSDPTLADDLVEPQPWRDRGFAGSVSARFGAPVHVRSSVHMKAMGELKAGAGRGVGDLLFVNLDRSIGAGIISDGQLHRGAQGAAGLIGHAPTGEEGAVTCRCGSRGCLEVMAGAEAMAREALTAAAAERSRYLAQALARNGTLTATDVGHGAQMGDGFCAELIARSGRLIGEGLAPLVDLLNPALIVLGGTVAQTGDIMLAAIREAVYRMSHPLATRDLRILRSQMGGSAGLVGAAQLVVEELFAPPMLKEWIHLGSPRRHPALHRLVEDARQGGKTDRGPPQPPKRRAGTARNSGGIEA